MNRYVSPPLTLPKVHLGLIPKGFPGTQKTVERMKELIRKGARDFYVRQKAIDILMETGVRPKAYLDEIQALFRWVQKNIRYTKDPHKVEVLHSARRMLQLRAGDCDDIAILLGAMLESIGHPVRLVLTGPLPDREDLFSHVFLEVNHRGRWIPLDATMPYPAGWSPAAAQRRVFPIEKEVKMLGFAEEVMEETPEIGVTDEDLLGEYPETYTYTQTIDGLGNLEDDLYGAAIAAVPWVRQFASRLLSQGVRRRDSNIRSIYNLLRGRGLLTRRGFARRFLRTAWRRGMPANSGYSRRFVNLLRTWGLIRAVGVLRRPGAGRYWRRTPSWYRNPPLWYRRPPSWYMRRRRVIRAPRRVVSRVRRVPAASLVRTAQAALRPVVRAALAPTAVSPTATRLPIQAARTARAVQRAPLRLIRSLF